MSEDGRARGRAPVPPRGGTAMPQSTQPPLGAAPAVRLGPGAAPGRPGVDASERHRVRQQRRERLAQTPPRAPRPANDARLAGALARSRAWARPAGLGARIGAYSIDAFACLVLAVSAGFAMRSLLIGVLVLVELAVILLIVESRTGATLGNLMLRLRTARDDAPYSPGVGRGFARGLVQGAGSLIALVGGWAVVATSAADPMRMGRSWADRAGRTLVVRVPSVAERQAWSRSAEAWAQSAAERPVPTPAPQPTIAPGQPAPAPATPQPAPTTALGGPQSETALPPGVVAVDAPLGAAPAPREVGALLLLAFDTGQRAQLRVPAIANLGRRPEPRAADDQLVTVEDPAGSVSKTHLRIEYRGDSIWVTDLGSTNGSRVVDETGESSPLASGARIRLEDGASVRIGQRSFTVAMITGEV